MGLKKLALPDEEDVRAWIADHIVNDMASDCELWEGKVIDRTFGDPPRIVRWPMIGLPGRQNEHVRRTWWRLNHPEENEDTMRGYRVRRDPEGTCHPLCVNPDHMLVEPAPGYVESTDD